MIKQKIQFTTGCPNNCSYCHEPVELKFYDPKIESNDVQILDMNFLANPKAVEILKSLPKGTYELICGVDYRRLTPEICELLKQKGFIKLRWAWDYNYGLQRVHQKIWRMFLKAGFQREELSVFILANWKIPFNDCLKKLDLLKVWNVKVNDCCYDGGYPKNEIDFNNNKRFINKHFWSYSDIKKFRKTSRNHNKLVRFKIDPEFK